jgi:anthraniloyl-CoA monooxygenase
MASPAVLDRPLRVASIGAGPAGLYLAILLKKSNPAHRVVLYERNAADDTFGWGVVFSEETLSYLGAADQESHQEIQRAFAQWDAIDLFYRGEQIRSGGHVFSGISRKLLLQILHARAQALGVEIHFKSEQTDVEKLLAENDLVLAADGVNSFTRERYAAHFEPTITEGKAIYIWLGTTLPLDAFTFFCQENAHGFFTVHAYRFDREHSTFIVETDEQSWRNAGLDRASTEQSIAYLEQLFASDLRGHRLLSNASKWIRFRHVVNKRWSKGSLVLLGDAAHTAHFSIGSGTKLAVEDAIALHRALGEQRDLATALAAYEAARRPVVESLQRAAVRSQKWFEEIKRYRGFAIEQLAFAMMTRSHRITHANLRLRDARFTERVDRWYAGEKSASGVTPPPMFTSFAVRGLELENRVVVAPMCQYACEDGLANDWHLVHLGARAQGGAGLVIAEMTDVCPTGRITPRCAGLWSEPHAAAWRRVTEFVHRSTRAKIGIQIAHAGRKGATKVPWEGNDQPLESGAWPLIAASALPYLPHSQVPRAMTRADMDEITAAFARSAALARQAEFDLLELHMAHGYLLASFLSPITNRRTDDYGGSVEKRVRYPLEVLHAVRAAWGDDRPISVRISAVDWIPGGNSSDDAVAIARALRDAGADLIHVSTGQTDPAAKPEYGRWYQTPFSDRIRNELGVPTITVGGFASADDLNTILAAGRADLCALAREHLRDPFFTLHAAQELGWKGARWPERYAAATTLKKVSKDAD